MLQLVWIHSFNDLIFIKCGKSNNKEWVGVSELLTDSVTEKHSHIKQCIQSELP